MAELDRDTPQPVVQRTATDLSPEELQAEFARYGIPAGDVNTRVAALQHKYDQEYEAGRHEHDEYVTQLRRKRVKEEYDEAVATMAQLETTALAQDDTATSIVQQIHANAAPKHLVVRNISPIACCALLRAMRSNTNVLTLDLSNNHLDDTVGAAVGKMLLKNKRLRGLNLGFNELTSQSLGPLGTALKANAVLTSLTLESNPILANATSAASSSSGSSTQTAHATELTTFEAFMVAIAVNNSLTALNLFSTQMAFDVSRALARALENNSTLIALEVGGNSISPSDVASIACKLQKNQALVADAQDKHARVRHEIRQSADEIHAQQLREAKRKANTAWHEANARQRAEQRDKDEWERAQAIAADEVRVAMEIQAQQKQYMERMEERKAKAAKGKK